MPVKMPMLTIPVSRFRQELAARLEEGKALATGSFSVNEARAWVAGTQQWLAGCVAKEDADFVREYRKATAPREEIIPIPPEKQEEETARRVLLKLRLQLGFLESLADSLDDDPASGRPPHLPFEVPALKERISQNRIEEVLEEMVRHLAQNPSPRSDHALFLQRAQMTELRQQHISGLLTEEEYQVARNRVAKAVLDWLAEMG